MTILTPQIVSLLGAQIVREQNAFQVYKAAGMWAERHGYLHSYKYLHAQAKEELHHRNRILRYLNDFGEEAPIPSTPAPALAYSSLPELFASAMQLEVDTTRGLSEVYSAALSAGDFVTVEWLGYYMKEQRKSYAELLAIQQLFAEFGTDGATLIDIDERIGKVG